LLAARRAILPSLSRLAPLTILEDATVPRARIAEMVERIDAITARHGVRIAAGAHAGDGNLHPTCVLHPADGAAIATAHHAFDGIFSRAGAGRARSPAKTAWDSPSCGIVASLVQPPARAASGAGDDKIGRRGVEQFAVEALRAAVRTVRFQHPSAPAG
jgi:hypothetical protein